MSNENINLAKTSDGKPPKGCDAYDKNTLLCTVKNKSCDMCYSDVKSKFN